MKKNEIIWNEDGWTVIREADAEKHIIEVSCKTENGNVVEIRIRHNDGEVAKGKATVNNKNILPMSLDEFKTEFKKGNIDFK